MSIINFSQISPMLSGKVAGKSGMLNVKRLLFITLIVLAPFHSAVAEPRVAKIPTVNECWRATALDYGSDESSMTPRLDNRIEAYKELVEESLVHREVAIRVMNRLRAEGKVDGSVPLSGYDLDMLNAGLMQHLELRAALYRVAYAQSCWHKPSGKIYRKFKLSPLTEMNQMKGTMLSLSAALILYDNYLMMSSMYDESSKLRRFLNQKDRAYAKGRNALKRLSLSYESGVKRRIVREAIGFYEQQLKRAPAQWFEDENFAYLNAVIEQSQSYNMLKKSSPLRYIGKHLAFMTAVSGDDLVSLKNEGINLFSGLFGNIMGLVESRKGKLYDDPKVLSHVSSQLRAGDILLEKTPFRLTDKLIPGHWGHAAIWIGTEAELKALGIWDDPAVAVHHQQIIRGASVVEALRSGVQMNSMHHFLNVDDLAVLRSRKLDRESRVKRILLALKQVGKDYDFNFDVETTDKIVCSELVYTVYTGMSWPTEKALGRYTISPDNVAKKAVDGGELNLVSFYHDGEEVKRHRMELMARLMGEKAVTPQGSVGTLMDQQTGLHGSVRVKGTAYDKRS